MVKKIRLNLTVTTKLLCQVKLITEFCVGIYANRLDGNIILDVPTGFRTGEVDSALFIERVRAELRLSYNARYNGIITTESLRLVELNLLYKIKQTQFSKLFEI